LNENAEMTPEARIKRNPQVVYREVGDGGGVLLHLDSGAYHGVNRIGTVIWELLDGERTRADVVAALSDKLEDPPAELEADVDAFLDGLQERDLISE
jgi:Coenzyme PQQ synthesis protein D (PqqD)